MNELVFLEPNKIDAIPFTTSKVIADFSGVRHDKVKAAINKHKKVIETFGLLTPHEVESMFGRPESIYKLNEQQATFLMTLLKNTPIVIEFKRRLVEQFYAMRTELMKRRTYRDELKPIRRELTDVIQIMDADNIWAYKQYTDLAYKAVTGKIAKKLREERGANKTAAAIDYMSSDEIQKVARKQSQIAVLRDMGMDYEQIKALVFHKVIPQIRVTQGGEAQ